MSVLRVTWGPLLIAFRPNPPYARSGTTGHSMKILRLVGLNVFVVSFGVLTTACATSAIKPNAVPSAKIASASSVQRDTHERLHGVLWGQTAAESWALAASTYRLAGSALDAALANPSWTAALEQTAGYETLPPAVVLDLDETVLDNSQFQGQLVFDRTDYVQDTWNAWVAAKAAAAVPGAVEFVSLAKQKGVTVFFVTNRRLSEQADTLDNLKGLGIIATDADVLCTDENGWTSDKTARRAFLAKTHRLLLLIGDDMNDFVSTAGLTSEARMKLAQSHSDRWGRSWMLIPNPLYGSWEAALYKRGTPDDEVLQIKRALVNKFKS